MKSSFLSHRPNKEMAHAISINQTAVDLERMWSRFNGALGLTLGGASLDKSKPNGVEFETSPADLAASCFYYLQSIDKEFHKRKIKRVFVAPLVGLVAAISLIIFDMANGHDAFGQHFFFFILGAIGFLLFFWSYSPWRIKRKLSAYFRDHGSKALLGYTYLSVNDNEAAVMREGVIFPIAWSSVFAIQKTADYLFGYSNAGMDFFAPRRAFKTDADFNHFYDKAFELWHTGKDRPASYQELF